jgi:hypothetical protein
MKYTKRIKNKRNRSSSSMMTRELSLAGSLVGASAITQGSEVEDVQNQNQNQSHSFMIGGTPSSSASASGCANELIRYFLELLNTIKIYHWSTLSYPTHKATDELHTKLSELVDSFIEIYIGHCSRIRGSGRGRGSGIPIFQFKHSRRGKGSLTSIPFITSIDLFCKFLDENIGNLNGLTKKLDGYTDLVNIRDEMVAALAQTLYLLRLK